MIKFNKELKIFWISFTSLQYQDKIEMLKVYANMGTCKPEAMRLRIDRDLLKAKCCQCCGSKKLLAKHHIVPIMNGGPTVERNLILLCHVCHGFVHTKTDKQGSHGAARHIDYLFYKAQAQIEIARRPYEYRTEYTRSISFEPSIFEALQDKASCNGITFTQAVMTELEHLRLHKK